jgi:hypothetical protein
VAVWSAVASLTAAVVRIRTREADPAGSPLLAADWWSNGAERAAHAARGSANVNGSGARAVEEEAASLSNGSGTSMDRGDSATTEAAAVGERGLGCHTLDGRERVNSGGPSSGNGKVDGSAVEEASGAGEADEEEG